ncbi:Clavaminate synthase-like protein [Schizophyllum commune Tattone D]|nr:Clavaminate synthase-like protein [Schizophyllum commune Tattone D]
MDVAAVLGVLNDDQAYEGYDNAQRTIADELAGIASDSARLFRSTQRLDDIVSLAHQAMPRAGPLLTGWRLIHTQACILAALADAPSNPLAAIARLDKAIIISGAAGHGRLDLILDLIDDLQAPLRSTSPHPTASSVPMNANTSPPSTRLPTASSAVRELPKPPSISAFQRPADQPFVLRGYALDWPCCADHLWASAAYLRAATGPGRLVPVEVGQDYRAEEWSQELMLCDTFLSYLDFPDQPRKADSPRTLYLAQHDLFMQFPRLKADLLIPDYVYACVGPDDYKPPANEERLVLNAWLGPAGTLSPAHTDPFFNFYVQVVGRKTVWLAPPSASPYMYAYADSQHPASPVKPEPGSSTPDTGPLKPDSGSSMLGNTSRVDVFTCDESASRREYPHFWEHVVPSASSVTLDAGDVLFFPPGWWHAMRSEATSFSVSMWF